MRTLLALCPKASDEKEIIPHTKRSITVTKIAILLIFSLLLKMMFSYCLMKGEAKGSKGGIRSPWSLHLIIFGEPFSSLTPDG
jgi:hypothetical protein